MLKGHRSRVEHKTLTTILVLVLCLGVLMLPVESPAEPVSGSVILILTVGALLLDTLATVIEMQRSGADAAAQAVFDNREGIRVLHDRMQRFGFDMTTLLKKLDQLPLVIKEQLTQAFEEDQRKTVLAIIDEFSIQLRIARNLERNADGTVNWENNPTPISGLVKDLSSANLKLWSMSDINAPVIIAAMTIERAMRHGIGEERPAVEQRMDIYYDRLEAMLDPNRSASLAQLYEHWKRYRDALARVVVSGLQGLAQDAKLLEILHPDKPTACNNKCVLVDRKKVTVQSALVVLGGLTSGNSAEFRIRRIAEQNVSRFPDGQHLLLEAMSYGQGNSIPRAQYETTYYFASTMVHVLGELINVIRDLSRARVGGTNPTGNEVKYTSKAPPDFASVSRSFGEEIPECRSQIRKSLKACENWLLARIKRTISRPAGVWMKRYDPPGQRSFYCIHNTRFCCYEPDLEEGINHRNCYQDGKPVAY